MVGVFGAREGRGGFVNRVVHQETACGGDVLAVSSSV